MIILATALVAAPLTATSTGAAVIKPKQAPKVGGALDPAGRDCERDVRLDVTFIDCQFDYLVRPAADGNPNRDYWVVWRQMKVVTSVCTRSYFASTASPANPALSVHRKAPGRTRIRFRRTKPYTTKLQVKAKRNERVGRVAKRWTVRKGRLITRVNRRDDGTKVIKQTWRGHSCKRTFGAAFGAEYSVPTEAKRAAGLGAPASESAAWTRRWGG